MRLLGRAGRGTRPVSMAKAEVGRRRYARNIVSGQSAREEGGAGRGGVLPKANKAGTARRTIYKLRARVAPLS
jgi:hypothetical protein